MPNENVGSGYSVGAVSDYADRYGAIQQGLAHRFDQYTNPFMLASNLSNVFQPGIQNAQKQQMVNIDQARQNMAQTAQDTLLPLQAQQYNVNADAIRAQTAMSSFNLGKAQDAYSQTPDLLNSLADAQNNNDPAAAFRAGANNPAAFTANPALTMDSLNRIFQQKAIQTQGSNAAAAATGADYVSQNPGATPDDIASSFKPTDGLSPAQQIEEKNAYLQGANHAQVQSSIAAAKGQITTAAAAIRANGTIDAATQKALSPLIQKGFFTPEALAAVGVDPDTADKLTAAVVSGKPMGNGTILPDKVAVANLGIAKSILANPLATTVEKNWAYSAMGNGGQPAFDLPTYAPAVQDKIDLIQGEINDQQKALEQNQKGWMWDSGDTQEALKHITDLKQQLIDVKKNNAKPAANSAQPNVALPTPAPNSFGQNQFMPNGGSPSIPGITDHLPSDGELPVGNGMSVPMNPDTSAALQATQPASFNPAATPTSTAPTSQTMVQAAQSGLDKKISQANTPPAPAIERLKKNPALAADFDAKYGKGLAARYLRQ